MGCFEHSLEIMGSGRFRRMLCFVALAAATSVDSFVGTPCSLFRSPGRLVRTSYSNVCRECPPQVRLQADTGDAGEGPAGVLRSAAETRKVPTMEVSEALRVLAEDSGPPAVFGAEEVEGSWELVFSTQLKSGYMPIRELVGFYPSREQASIDANAGPLPLGGMRGQCWWKGGLENELAFMLGAVKIGPFKFGKDNNEVKTYKFIFNDGKILAAKSSSGGFALLSRVTGED
ncbi:unnamed protein product [Scytosiphon promiscuus]